MILEITDKHSYNEPPEKTIIDTKLIPEYMVEVIDMYLKEADFFNLKSEPLDTLENPRYIIIKTIKDIDIEHEVVSVLEFGKNYQKVYHIFSYVRMVYEDIQRYQRNYLNAK